jgi:hypothetical protein
LRSWPEENFQAGKETFVRRLWPAVGRVNRASDSFLIHFHFKSLQEADDFFDRFESAALLETENNSRPISDEQNVRFMKAVGQRISHVSVCLPA